MNKLGSEEERGMKTPLKATFLSKTKTQSYIKEENYLEPQDLMPAHVSHTEPSQAPGKEGCEGRPS